MAVILDSLKYVNSYRATLVVNKVLRLYNLTDYSSSRNTARHAIDIIIFSFLFRLLCALTQFVLCNQFCNQFLIEFKFIDRSMNILGNVYLCLKL